MSIKAVLPEWVILRVRQRRIYQSLPDHVKSYIDGLSPADVCIDWCANVGSVTSIFARKGAQVFAFEPNPFAYAKLIRNTRQFSRVTCMQAGVSAGVSGRMRLHFTDRHKDDPVEASIGSTFVRSKPDVGSDGVDVEVVDLVEFVKTFDRVRLLKIDVEGYEVELVPSLIESGALDCVDRVFVENHMYENWKGLLDASERMLKVAEESPYANKIFFDWP